MKYYCPDVIYITEMGESIWYIHYFMVVHRVKRGLADF
jgi:hypothetical protein